MAGLLSKICKLLLHKKNPYTQFVKYVVCGCISVVVDAVVFYLLAWLLFPCLQPGDPIARLLGLLGYSVTEVSAEVLIRNYWIVKVICFLLSNGIVYLLNILFVFESGRHHRVKEMGLFFSISAIIFITGASLGATLIQDFGWHMTYAYIFILSLGIAANFLLRKIVVFKF